MGVIAYTAAAYARMMQALLPPGRLWRLDPASLCYKALLGAADELVRISGRAVDLITEDDPQQATELLPDYEAELGLVSTGTDAERRTRIVAQLTRRQRFRPADVKAALAPDLALDPADVVLIELDRADAIAANDDRIIYQFYVYRDPADPGTPDIAAAQALLDSISHSHVRGYVIESIDFICDDADSLCDRDTLGV